MRIRLAFLVLAISFTLAARANTPVASLEIRYLPVGAMLSWSCESSDVAGFSVERSTDGFTFETISRVVAEGGTSLTYNYLDTDRPTTKIYYRITSFDLSGTSAHSALAEAPATRRPSWYLAGGYSVEPTEAFSFEVEASDVSFLACELLDFMGKPVLTQELLVQPGQNLLSVPVAGLAPGAYRLKVSGEDLAETLTFMKARDEAAPAFEPLVRGNE